MTVSTALRGLRRIGRVAISMAALSVLTERAAVAQTTVVLPDSSQTSVVSVTVSEQARVAVPAGISFTVNNIGAVTSANAAAVTIDQIVLSSATKQLRVSLRAEAASFTPPGAGAITWSASDVSWGVATWTGATGAAGVLSNATFNPVATCNAGATGCSTTGLMFSLAAKPSVQRSGTHTLLVTWKVESIGS